MASFNSLQMTPPVYPVSGPGIGGRSKKIERAYVDLAVTGTMAIGDTVNLFKLHPRFRVMSGFIKSTGAAASSTIAVGIAGTPALFFAATGITTAATTVTLAETGRDYLTSAYTTVIGTIAGAATGATGTLTIVLEGYIEEPA